MTEMKECFLARAVTVSIAMVGLCLACDADDRPLRLELQLTDGSRLIGTTTMTSVVIRTEFALVHVPLPQVSDIQIQCDRENAVVRLCNGDRLTGIPRIETIPLSTLFGSQSIGIQHVDRISIRDARGVPADLAEFLVLHYSFDTEERDRVTDLSPKRNDGTIVGPVFTSEGKSGGAMYFDGLNDYLDAGNPSSLRLTTNFTMAAWIWPERTKDGFGIVTKSHGVPEQERRSIEFCLGQDDTLSAYFWDDSTRYFSGVVKNRTIPRQEWSHVVLLHDSALPEHQMRAFINGVPCEMNYGYETVSSIPVVRTVAEPLRIGCMRPGVHQFKGRIDEVMVFNRRLSEDDIARLYQSAR
jgi:hypothetical protein